MDNDKIELNKHQPEGEGCDAKNVTGQRTDKYHEDIDCIEGFSLDVDNMDYGKTLLIELDRLERELKKLD